MLVAAAAVWLCCWIALAVIVTVAVFRRRPDTDAETRRMPGTFPAHGADRCLDGFTSGGMTASLRTASPLTAAIKVSAS